MKGISLAGIACDLETEILILTMYLKKYLKKSTTLGKYLNTNTFHSSRSITNTLKIFIYFQIQMYLTPCLHYILTEYTNSVCMSFHHNLQHN